MKIDYLKLREACYKSEDSFQILAPLRDDGNIFIDNRSNVLAIAHLDSVNYLEHFHVIAIDGNDLVFNTHLDDRLGVYVLLELLPQLGIFPDILLTTGEEKGASTGKYFKPSKQYNWMFQFDRSGDDAVHYQYKEWKPTLLKYFTPVLQGAASDISKMSHLKCMGVNIGVGYYDEHDYRCSANMTETITQVRRFEKMWHDLKDVAFPYEEPAHAYYPPAPITPPPATVAISNILYLDYSEYQNKPAPEFCSSCGDQLILNPSNIFMGFCAQCEGEVDQCEDGKWRLPANTHPSKVCDLCLREASELTTIMIDMDEYTIDYACLKLLLLESETTNEHTENGGERPAILQADTELPETNSKQSALGILYGEEFSGSSTGADTLIHT